MKVRLDDGAELFYKVDDFTDPWTEPETAVLHHGMAKSHKMWFGWAPVLARHYRVIRFDMRGMGQSAVPEPGYPWSLDDFANDLLGVLDRLELEKVHLIGETVGGSISMRFATLHQQRLSSLTVCSSPTSFSDLHHAESAELIDREGMASWMESTITRRLDPQMVDPAYIRWYARQMAATPAHVVSRFQRNAGGDLRPLLKEVQTPTLVLAAASLREEVLGDFRGGGGPVSQRTAGGLPRRHRLHPAHPAGALRPGVAGFRQRLKETVTGWGGPRPVSNNGGRSKAATGGPQQPAEPTGGAVSHTRRRDPRSKGLAGRLASCGPARFLPHRLLGGLHLPFPGCLQFDPHGGREYNLPWTPRGHIGPIRNRPASFIQGQSPRAVSSAP